MNIRPTVSAVIPCYNRAGLLLQTIDSLSAQMLQGDEIIVVDDGSEEDTAEQAARRHPLVKVTRQKHTGTLCQVRNHGAALAVGDLLLFLGRWTEKHR